MLCQLLQFPTPIELVDPAPQHFALQFWDSSKGVNAGVVIGILGILVGSKASSVRPLINTFTHPS